MTVTMREKQSQFTKHISAPKRQSTPSLQTFMPDLVEGGKYQTYQ